MQPLITIVISSFNRADKLDKALQGIVKQQDVDYDQYEVLVVDNNSTDNSQAVALGYQGKLNLQFITEKKQGLGNVRDTGYLQSKGSYIAYLDDDAIPDPGWLKNLLEIIESDRPDCICGPISPYYDSDKPDWFLDEYEVRSKGEHKRFLVNGEECSGSNMTWRTEILKNLGGFDRSFGMRGDYIIGGEDSDLFRRYWEIAGTQFEMKGIIYHPDVKVTHWVPAYKMHVQYILRRNFAAGIATAKLRKTEGTIKKVLTSSKLILEMGFVIIRFPLMRFTYTFKENWLVGELRRLYFRAGWLATYLRISKHPKTQK